MENKGRNDRPTLWFRWMFWPAESRRDALAFFRRFTAIGAAFLALAAALAVLELGAWFGIALCGVGSLLGALTWWLGIKRVDEDEAWPGPR